MFFSDLVDGTQKVYVGNIPFASTKEDLEEYFSKFGTVKDVFAPLDSRGEPRGFAFVAIMKEEAEAVIQATNGMEFMGRDLNVNIPLPPGEKPQKRPGKLFRGMSATMTIPVYSLIF
jgi:RNA recognition motif-containing protein